MSGPQRERQKNAYRKAEDEAYLAPTGHSVPAAKQTDDGGA